MEPARPFPPGLFTLYLLYTVEIG